MRRAFHLLALTNLWLLFVTPFAFGAADSTASQQQGSRKQVVTIKSSSAPSAARSTVLDTWRPVTGAHKATRDAAREDALKGADEQLHEYLRQIRPETDWSPRELRKFVNKMLVPNSEDIPQDEDVVIDGKPLFVATVQLQLTKELQGELLHKLRLDEARERQWWAAKGLFAALALFAAVGLYYRFDERTKGYYTNWLRLGALAFLALVGYGILRLS
jgi:hypothetical protein